MENLIKKTANFFLFFCILDVISLIFVTSRNYHFDNFPNFHIIGIILLFTTVIYRINQATNEGRDPYMEGSREWRMRKDMLDEYNIYHNIEQLAKEIFAHELNNKKIICANVDLYAGLVYQMLNLPKEIFTSLFSVARIASWNAHRIEQIFSDSKIIRPAYISLDEDGNVVV